jgi:steroid delta-isomerase-like uncharacterized protein
MSMASAKEAADRHVRAINDHDLDAVNANEAEDVEWVAPGATLRGYAEVRGFIQPFFDAFPDAHITVVSQVVAEPVAVTEGIFGGTHTGTLRSPGGDIPPSGKTIALRYSTVQRVESGRIVAEHLYFDQVELLTQIGAMPAPAAA